MGRPTRGRSRPKPREWKRGNVQCASCFHAYLPVAQSLKYCDDCKRRQVNKRAHSEGSPRN